MRIFESDYIVVSVEDGILSLLWSREEPNDEHAVRTAEQITPKLTEYLDAHPDERLAMVVDLSLVKHTFPRALTNYARWITAQRKRLRGGSFVSGNFLLKVGILATVVVPGISVKSFGNVAEARAHAQQLVARAAAKRA